MVSKNQNFELIFEVSIPRRVTKQNYRNRISPVAEEKYSWTVTDVELRLC